jgi:hypothetical protein
VLLALAAKEVDQLVHERGEMFDAVSHSPPILAG